MFFTDVTKITIFRYFCIRQARRRHGKSEKRNWKVLTSEYLARKPWFTVRHESIELPDGRRIPDYYVFEYPDWVNVIAITKEGKFVFIDQYRHGLGETDYESRRA